MMAASIDERQLSQSTIRSTRNSTRVRRSLPRQRDTRDDELSHDAHAMRFSDEDRAPLKAFTEAESWHQWAPDRPDGRSEAGVSSGRGGFRTCDLSRVKNEEDADPEAEGQR
jgi:hypothetical protein